jgi:hypothetical protein
MHLTAYPVPKTKFYQQFSKEKSHPSAELALLVMVMQLLARGPTTSTPAEADLYLKAKKFFNYLETRNLLSLKLVQAGLLLALYEIGNAIYPAAFLTIGHCARLAQTMGINDLNDSVQMFPAARTPAPFEIVVKGSDDSPPAVEFLPDPEEERRAWWGILLLDR